MQYNFKRIVFFFIAGFISLSASACNQKIIEEPDLDYNFDPLTTEECRIRDGLPNFFEKIKNGSEPVKIVFLGGSITNANNGWRDKILSRFRQQYPDKDFVGINAAISGTGSGFASCRMETDVLHHNPDLIFVEFRANGGEGVEKQSVESIVRQTWRNNQSIDVCFVYTVTESMRENILSGKNTSFGTVMEQVANHYGIPSIDLGVDVVEKERKGQLIFRADVPVEGKILFSKDGTHPLEEGHNIYTDIIERNFLSMSQSSKQTQNRLKRNVFTGAWDVGGLISIDSTEKSTGWQLIDVVNDPVYTRDKVRSNNMLRGAVKCDKAGETITVMWEGTTLGINDITENGEVIVEVEIDGMTPVVLKRTQNNKEKLYARNFFITALPQGKHVAKLTVKSIPQGESYYAGQFMFAGLLED